MDYVGYGVGGVREFPIWCDDCETPIACLACDSCATMVEMKGLEDLGPYVFFTAIWLYLRHWWWPVHSFWWLRLKNYLRKLDMDRRYPLYYTYGGGTQATEYFRPRPEGYTDWQEFFDKGIV